MTRTLIGLAWVALATGLLSAAPALSQDATKKPVIKNEVAKRTPVDSGSTMFHEYCAPCHGARGEGNGPAAAALKTQPANLTLLAKKNGGVFPAKHVEDVLQHGIQMPAHGSSEMPVWGPTFRALGGDSAVVTLRIANIRDYLKTLQAK